VVASIPHTIKDATPILTNFLMIYFSYYRELFRRNSYSNLSTSIVVHWTHLPFIFTTSALYRPVPWENRSNAE
ncbi:MAG: hypothetical protein E6884_10100, partial [Streptococcus mitis]|nr:hypothetical protein [Streptococcus mitis]